MKPNNNNNNRTKSLLFSPKEKERITRPER